ncbi:fimbrial biogenesis chaperone [Acinetobacter sp. Lyrl_1]|uniref:fimbrial biogenesis chaperone n=1 Tax=Acinetobacter sp. Lyrl_1 TaxID=3110920 RepID=UPI003F7BF4B3
MWFLIRSVFGFLFSLSVAHAVTISPTVVELSAKNRVASITVTNTSDKKLHYQVNTLSWSQLDGIDQYSESRELLVVPAITEIAAGASQIFRVTPRYPQTNSIEQSYRLVLENITAITPNDSIKTNSVVFRISHDLPIFLSPTTRPIQNAVWHNCSAPNGKGCIRIKNTGNQRMRLSGIDLEGTNWQKELKIVDTVLAGAWKQWIYDLPTGQLAPLKVKIKTERGFIEPILAPQHDGSQR